MSEIKAVITSVIVCLADGVAPPFISDLENQVSRHENTKVIKINNITTALPQIQQSEKSVFIVGLSDKSDLVNFLKILETIKTQLESGLHKVIAINKLEHPKIPQMLKSQGCSEVLGLKLGQKEFYFKVNNYIKLVSQAHSRLLKSAKLKGTDLSKDSKKNIDKLGAQNSRDTKAQIQWDTPITLESDFWIITNKRNARSVLGRWLIQILGPGPTSGTWVKSGITLNEESGWEWKIKPEYEPKFKKNEGSWFFFGREPEFVWKLNMWSFVSEHPTLAFYVEKEAKHYRFLCENKSKLLIAENSEFSKKFIEAIRETIDSSIRFKDEKRSSSKEETAFDEGINASHTSDLEIEDPEQLSKNHSIEKQSDTDNPLTLELYEDLNNLAGGALGSSKTEGDSLDWSKLKKRKTLQFEDSQESSSEKKQYLMEYEEPKAKEEESPWKSGTDALVSIKLELLITKKNEKQLTQSIAVNFIESQDNEIILDTPASSIVVSEVLNIDRRKFF